VLARIDTIILFGALTVLLVLLDRHPLVEWAKRFGLMAAGAFPLYIYFIVNEVIFGQPSPISGTAKSLKMGLHFDPVGLTWTLGAIRAWMFPKSQLLLLAVCLIAAGFVSLLSQRTRSLPGIQLAVLTAGIAFPILHILILAIIGDWQLFFIWYYYTFVFATVCGAILSYTAIPVHGNPRLHPTIEICGAAVVVIGVIFVGSLRLGPLSRNYTYRAAVKIADFAKSHPGRYAMGDRGAVVGFLLANLGDPMVQTEGIVMDRAFLMRIRSESDLFVTLRDYHVDYYIASDAQFDGRCYHLSEPYWAGPHSPKMKAIVCEKPYRSFTDPPNDIFVVSAAKTPVLSQLSR